MPRPESPARLVSSPVFLLSVPRSGSTLLRNILDTHRMIHAAPEWVLTELGVEFLRFPTRYGMHTIYTELGFRESGLDTAALEFLLWDRILHHALVSSGSPNAGPRPDIYSCCGTPVNVLASGRGISNGTSASHAALTDLYLRYLYLLRDARNALPGLTVRYEDLTTDPARVCQQICEFLRVPWEPGILDYGTVNHGRLAPGAGDISAKLRSGQVQPGRPLPAEANIPLVFRPICVEFGYASLPPADVDESASRVSAAS